jgi:hypothetical protein
MGDLHSDMMRSYARIRLHKAIFDACLLELTHKVFSELTTTRETHGNCNPTDGEAGENLA